MSNLETVERIILGRTATAAAKELHDQGLLMPDLPEPKLYGELAEFGDEEVFAACGTSKVRIYIDDARMSSESARELALMLLAAANYAETEHPS